MSGSRRRFLEVTLAEMSGSRRIFLDVTLADISRSNSGEEWRFLEVTLTEISRSRPGGYFWKIFWRRFLEVIVLDVECVRAVGWQVVGPEHLPLLSSSEYHSYFVYSINQSINFYSRSQTVFARLNLYLLFISLLPSAI